MSEDLLAHLRRTSSIESLQAATEKLTNKEYDTDDRFWFPKTDKAGNGSALIRFLPAPPPETEPFVRYWYHSFKGPTNKWYWENCLTSIGKDDPVVEYNSKLYALSDDKDSPSRKQVSAQKRKLVYISNVYVVRDPATPENEGKIFLMKYGQTIYDMIQKKLKPVDDGLTKVEAINVFDIWNGADFAMRIHKEQSYTKYTKSEFQSPSRFMANDEEALRVLKNLHPLKPFLDPSQYKPYAELKKKLYEVLGLNEEIAASIPQAQAPSAPSAPAQQERSIPSHVSDHSEASSPDAEDPEGDEMASFFKNLGKKS